ncbi:MAG: hydrogenase expression/formation protein HypE [Saprospiraceae bacterium]|nr:hydrogenase expression/formation protein HypE [Saprospiraceae bacterium]
MELQCPLPKLDFDIITLGHGSGGVLSHKLLNKTVFELLSNPQLDDHHDGAVFQLDGQTAFSTDSFVVTPIFFPGGNIGDLAVNGTVNDVAMCGAIPQYISLSLILEEGLKMTELWEILCSIKAACDEAGVIVVTGDTKVVERGKGDKIFINTSGIGKLHPKAQVSISRIEEGDIIIVSGNIGTHGTTIMAEREGLKFETQIKSDTRNLNKMSIALLDKFGSDIKFFRDPTRGGIATVLNEIAVESKLEVEIQQALLPVEKQVAALCEILGLDPLYVANEGIFLTIVSPHIAEEVLLLLKEFEGGVDASVIGKITGRDSSKVILKSGIGGKRVVSMLVGEQLPRIC